MSKRSLILFCFLYAANVFAQHSISYQLEDVTVGDRGLRFFSGTQSVHFVTDSAGIRQSKSLTEKLRYNSTIYFKENGLGMVSSPSFRGTTAQQTAVVWHGIYINSQLNGQTDFNTLNVSSQQTIAVRGGGGSVLYGSSAIGGTVNIDSHLAFENRFNTEIQTSAGSFGTTNFAAFTEASNDRTNLQVSVARKDSQNNYQYYDSKKKNQNGQFYNTNFDISFGQKIGKQNLITYYGQSFEGERHFSGTFSSIGKTKYEDENFRNMIDWENSGKNYSSNLTIASIAEKYKYFENKKSTLFTYGKSESYLAKYHFQYFFKNSFKLHSIFQETFSKGWGSDLRNNDRNVFEAAILATQNLSKKFGYEIGARAFVNSDYGSPLLFSAGSKYLISKSLKLRANVSRNFRVPTFNDLYWNGSGNADLKPENALQYEVGSEFQKKYFSISTTLFYNDIQNLLRWTPNSSGNWTPQNVSKVATYGAELNFNLQKHFGESRFSIGGNYAYTISQDQETEKQLIYVPLHKATATLVYAFRKVSFGGQALYNGEVCTSSDNLNVLDSYIVANFFAKYKVLKFMEFAFEIKNTFAQQYATVLNRPMPGRNFEFSINFNI